MQISIWLELKLATSWTGQQNFSGLRQANSLWRIAQNMKDRGMATVDRFSTEPIRLDYPDEEIRIRVLGFLKTRHFPAFRKLEIVVEHGIVSVSGVVQSYYEKQIALTSCQHVPGVLSLVDKIAVEEPLRASASESSLVAKRLVG